MTNITEDQKNITLPLIAAFSSNYGRYNSSIGQGANKTTHTAEVKFDNQHELAVVKAFSIKDRGWLNEYISWTLGKLLKISQPPKSLILVASHDDLKDIKDQEIARARNLLADKDDLVVFWCASRISIKPPHHLSKQSWEEVVLRGEVGQKIAAFDGWIGNCDRIASNAPLWINKGVIAAIDHERLAFNQDWFIQEPKHFDHIGIYETVLLEKFQKSLKANKFSTKQSKTIIAALETFSNEHADAMKKSWNYIEEIIIKNVSPEASNNLKNFLSKRCEEDVIKQRLGVL